MLKGPFSKLGMQHCSFTINLSQIKLPGLQKEVAPLFFCSSISHLCQPQAFTFQLKLNSWGLCHVPIKRYQFSDPVPCAAVQSFPGGGRWQRGESGGIETLLFGISARCCCCELIMSLQRKFPVSIDYSWDLIDWPGL